MTLILRLLDRLLTPNATIATAVRWSSSSGHTINDTVKKKLKELYRRVHPDFFHGANEAKAANEKSFKLLQEYLSAADHKYGSGNGGGHPNLPYKFNFYIKHQHSIQQHQTDKNDDNAKKEKSSRYHNVSLTLPPPNRALPHTTHHALTKLFSACGIEASAAEMTSDGTKNTTTTTTTGESLSHWLPGIAELYYQSHGAYQGDPQLELKIIRTALQISHSISLLFGAELATRSVLPQLEAARRFANILDQCPLEIYGLRIGLGDGFGTDASGTVWLHAEAETTTWMKYLQEPGVIEWCHRRREKQFKVREKERQVAIVLGISLVLAPDSDVSNSEEYEVFLQRVLDSADQGLSIDENNFNKVCLHVTAGSASSSSSSKEQQRIISDGEGRIIVPVSSSTTELFSALRRLGPEAQRCAEIASKEEAEMLNLKTRVERKLHLRKLKWHPDLPAHKFRAGCLRMLEHSSTLGPLLDGLPVRLGEVNAFYPGQSHIDISWSFSP
ncbi:hypothetical protein Ndes2526B_g02957 [Nannochloris sp. 'desiccata']|nr:hypothetical protein KSW81_006794 [Chlorella desiccata (nom. nud.)]